MLILNRWCHYIGRQVFQEWSVVLTDFSTVFCHENLAPRGVRKKITQVCKSRFCDLFLQCIIGDKPHDVQIEPLPPALYIPSLNLELATMKPELKPSRWHSRCFKKLCFSPYVWYIIPGAFFFSSQRFVLQSESLGLDRRACKTPGVHSLKSNIV